jgi:DNA polymerase III gamma/tau subunit
MLKILEEPPNNVLFVLTSPSTSRLLPTIVSRTKVVKVERSASVKPDEKVLSALESFMEKGQFSSVDFNTFQAKTGEEGLEICDQMCLFFRKRLLKDKNSAKALKEILRLRALIENNNITPQMTIDHILIFISKTYNMKL